MPLDENGLWYPDLFDRQLEVFNCRARATLVCGPRLSGKSYCVCHRIVRHLWEVPDASVAMFARTMKNSKDGGTWTLLHDYVVKEWIKADIGFRYTTVNAEGRPGWKVAGDTRTPFFRVRNAHGGESMLRLFSLNNDCDIEARMKETFFSMFYFSELDKFTDRMVLSLALPQLRMPHLSYDQQMWIADTNPSEEGEDSWIYDVWYRQRGFTFDEHKSWNEERGLPVMTETQFAEFKSGLRLIEIKPEENPRLDPRQVEELKQTYSYDRGLYERYVNGKWVYGDGDKSRHFRSYFNANRHVVGNAPDGVDEANWEIITPSSGMTDLITGWDLGDTNHAVAFLEPVKWKDAKGHDVTHFNLLDELVSVKQEISIPAVAEEALAMIEALEEHLGHQLNTERSWSDRSSIERYQATGDTYPHLQVHAATNGRIFLRGVPKAQGSVRVRVQLMKLLLAQGRIHISAHCKWTIQMLKDLKKGQARLHYVVPDENKHIFDAITYALLMECSEDLEDQLSPVTTGQRQVRQPLIVQV